MINEPVKLFYNSLPNWDGEDRVKQVLDSLVLADEDNQRHRVNEDLKDWLGKMVVSPVDEGVINEKFLFLVGGQGVGKSRFLSQLLPEELKSNYFLQKDSDINDSECTHYMVRKILIENQAEDNNFSILTWFENHRLEKLIIYRPFYGGGVYPRVASLALTTEDEFIFNLKIYDSFKDICIPIHVQAINPIQLDSKQLFAQLLQSK